RAALLRGLAEAYAAAGQLEQARQAWEQFAKLPGRGDDLRVQLMRFDLAVRVGDLGKLPELVGELKGSEGPGGALWPHAGASGWMRVGRKDESVRADNLEKARALLEQVTAARPTWPAGYLTRADMEDLKGNPEQAIASYRKAVELGERGP